MTQSGLEDRCNAIPQTVGIIEYGEQLIRKIDGRHGAERVIRRTIDSLRSVCILVTEMLACYTKYVCQNIRGSKKDGIVRKKALQFIGK